MRDLATRLKEGLYTATKTAKLKAMEAKLIINKKLNHDLFEGILAGCVLIMNTSLKNKTDRDRLNEEHSLLISLAEKGITDYFTQEEITNALAQYMSIFESGNYLAGYGYCIATIAQIKKDSDISQLIKFMYDVSAADGDSDPEERQIIVDIAGFLKFKNYAVVEPELTGFVPFKMPESQSQIEDRTTQASPPQPKTDDTHPPKTDDDGIPDWMKK